MSPHFSKGLNTSSHDVTKVHSGKPTSLPGLLTEHGRGVDGGSMSDPKAAMLESLPRHRNDDSPKAATV